MVVAWVPIGAGIIFSHKYKAINSFTRVERKLRHLEKYEVALENQNKRKCQNK